MKIAFAPRWTSGLLIVPFWEKGEIAADFDLSSMEEAVKQFKGKKGESQFHFLEGKPLLFLGLGPKEEASIEGLRRAYGAAIKAVQGKESKDISLLFPKCKQKESFLQGIAEGVLLANYSYSYKSKEVPVLVEKITFVGVEKSDAFDEMQEIVKGVNFVRDLVNENADEKFKILTSAAKHLHPKIKTTIFDRKRLEKEGMGLILAVNRASSVEPCLIEAVYRGDPKSKEHVVLVGKGVTYDTGGLSLKPTDSMLGMKCDMAGCATALGTIRTAAELGLKVNITAIAPVVENCIGKDSYKLGDVYRSYSGKTVEINNTDAEGRLILADALSYAVTLKPSCIIDLATLTGACVVALGEEVAGLCTNDDLLAEELLDASEVVDELVCRLPLYTDYKEAFKSDIADMTNSGGRDAGMIKGALFLHEFVGDVPWAHLDIAGVAYWTKPKHYHPTKATGFGVRLLIEFLKRMA